MSYLDCRNILKYSNFWNDYYEKVVGLFLISLLRNHHNTIQQKKICFFYIHYIVNMSNDDFKFAIKKLVHIYYNKIKYIVIEKNLTYFFSKINIEFA